MPLRFLLVDDEKEYLEEWSEEIRREYPDAVIIMAETNNQAVRETNCFSVPIDLMIADGFAQVSVVGLRSRQPAALIVAASRSADMNGLLLRAGATCHTSRSSEPFIDDKHDAAFIGIRLLKDEE